MAYKIKKDPIGKIPKGQLIFWLIVRLAMIICATYSFVKGDLVMGFESVFCFIFTHLWDMFQVFGNGSFIEEVPPLSQTCLNAIIFVGIVLGSYFELFDKISWFDIMMHFATGIVCAVFGYDFAVIIQRKRANVQQRLQRCSALCLCFQSLSDGSFTNLRWTHCTEQTSNFQRQDPKRQCLTFQNITTNTAISVFGTQ